jgi:hypothetical protein
MEPRGPERQDNVLELLGVVVRVLSRGVASPAKARGEI